MPSCVEMVENDESLRGFGRYRPAPSAPSTGVWTQNNGVNIRVKDMGLRHLKNTLRLVRARTIYARMGNAWLARWETVLVQELRSRELPRR